MPKGKTYKDVQSAAYDIAMTIEDYLSTEGVNWLVKIFKTNVIRTVYRRKPSTFYRRTDSFKDSIRGRNTIKGKHGMTYGFELMAFADTNSMEPHHTSWASGKEWYGNINVDSRLEDWLNYGHAGMGVHYKPAKFIEKTEQMIKNPKGLIAGLHTHLRKSGFSVVKNGADLV